MDLSPREAVPTAVGRKRKRPWLAMGVLAVVLVGGGVLVFQFLTKAIDQRRFAFFGTALSGTTEQEPRWKRCVRAAIPHSTPSPPAPGPS